MGQQRHLDAEEIAQHFRVEQRLGRAVKGHLARFQRDDSVGVTRGEIDVVQDHDDMPRRRAAEPVKKRHDLVGMGEIERRNTMTLEQYFPPENLPIAQERLEQLRLNTTGYLARKAAEHTRGRSVPICY